MAEQVQEREIYIVLSQTGSLLSRFLRLVTGKEYNHSSISMDWEMTKMYSFGRRTPYNPLFAGFVQESPKYGTFKRFPKTEVVVIAFTVDDQVYREIGAMMEDLKACSKELHYDFLGLFLAWFRIHYRRHNHFYCSEFVKTVLQYYAFEGSDQLAPITHPVDFMELPGADVVYRGKLCDMA